MSQIENELNYSKKTLYDRQRDGDIFTPIHIFTKEPYKPKGPNEVLFTLPLPGDNDHLRYIDEPDGTVTFIDPEEAFIEAYSAYVEAYNASHPDNSPDTHTQDEATTGSSDHNPPENDDDITPTVLRTKGNAGRVDIIPDMIPFPSGSAYQNALALQDSTNPHMVALYPSINLTYDGTGHLLIDGQDQTTVNIVDIKDQSFTSLDTAKLGVLYGIVWAKMKPKLDTMSITADDIRNFGVVLYVPDLAKVMLSNRGQSGYSQHDIDRIVEKLQSYTHVIGIIDDKVGGKTYQSKYPLLVWTGYDARTNTVSFVAPFFSRLAMDIYNSSLKKNFLGVQQFNRNGTPAHTPMHTHLVKSTLASERNKRACEIVRIICVLIEQTGNKAVPHIKARTIVERVDGFAEALENSTSISNANRLLSRAFGKAFELLTTQTILGERYTNIRLPNFQNVVYYPIPTVSTLDKIVYEFPHQGKRKQKRP